MPLTLAHGPSAPPRGKIRKSRSNEKSPLQLNYFNVASKPSLALHRKSGQFSHKMQTVDTARSLVQKHPPAPIEETFVRDSDNDSTGEPS